MTGPQFKYSSQENQEWRGEAACRNIDPDLFFPVGVGHDAAYQTDLAKAVCGSCVVKAECLDYALSAREDYGIWGGTTEEERRQVTRGRTDHIRKGVN